MEILKRTQFGNPILREVARPLTQKEILSSATQTLIKNMRHTLKSKKLGVGLAAPQVNKNLALAIIHIRPTKHRSDVEPFEAVLINPEITETVGRRKSMWEGCISGGPGKAGLFAKVPRYKQVRVKYCDEKGKLHEKFFKGLQAQVAQHEVDHLNGILFVDRVKDSKTFMTYSEYMKRVRSKKDKVL